MFNFHILIIFLFAFQLAVDFLFCLVLIEVLKQVSEQLFIFMSYLQIICDANVGCMI